MAGSYNHCVRHQDEDGHGELLANEDLLGMLENGGDVYEAIEEMYGMIWWLAAKIESDGDAEGYYRPAASQVEDARKNYQEGLRLSPGTGARLPEPEEE